jgi:hypothetical protein
VKPGQQASSYGHLVSTVMTLKRINVQPIS